MSTEIEKKVKEENKGGFSIVRNPLDEIVFEHKNRRYGAYELRKKYAKNMAVAIFLSSFMLAMVFIGPKLLEMLGKDEEEDLVDVPVKIIRTTELDAPPPLDDTKPPPPPPDIPPPPQEVVKFTEPKLTEERPPDPPPPVDELKKTQTGQQNQEGEKKEFVDPGPIKPPPPPPPPKKVDEVIEVVDEEPEFPGGFGEFQKFLISNIQYPEFCRQNSIQGKVLIQILIEKNGKITEIKQVRAPHPQLFEEAARVIQKTKWNPAKVNGNPVRYRYTVPVDFRLGR